MKRPLFIFLILFGTAGSHRLNAAAPISMENAVSQALSNNVELAAARLTIAQAEARVQQAGRPGNPEFETEFAPNLNGHERGWRVGLSQKFPLTGRLKFEKQISQSHLQLAQAELEDFERRLCFQVRTTFINLVSAKELLRLNAQQIEMLSGLASNSEQAAKAGEGAEVDVALIELERAQLSSQRLKLEAELQGHSQTLKFLLGLPEETELDAEHKSEIGAARESIPLRIERRPDYRAALARKEGEFNGPKLARANRWEDVTVGIFGGLDRTEDEPAGIENDRVVGFRVAVPLPLWKNNKARIAEAEAAALRSEKEVQAAAARITAEVQSALAMMNAAFKQAESIKSDLLPRSRALEEKLTALHKQGQAGFVEVARARERRLQFESAEVEARRDYCLAEARFWSASGFTTLSDHE